MSDFLIDKIPAGGTKIGNHRTGGLAFADDLVLLAPSNQLRNKWPMRLK